MPTHWPGEYRVEVYYDPSESDSTCGWWTVVAYNNNRRMSSGGQTFEEAMSGLDDAIHDAKA